MKAGASVPRRRFGPAGREVAVVGQGTWMLETAERPAALAALGRGLDLGLTHIDTAEMYGSGRVEELVGEAIAARREEVFLVSKVLPENASQEGTVRACEASLKRLGTEYLDLYLLHWPGPHPLAGTFAAFDRLQASAKIGAWGVSNFDRAGLEQALAAAGPGRIACNQVCYHLEARTIEHEIIPWCERHRVAVVAYSPFGSGDFPARGPGRRVLDEVAAAHGASAHQVALAFLVRRAGLFAIPKAARTEHLEENAAAGRLELGAAEVKRIEAAFPLGPKGPLPTA